MHPVADDYTLSENFKAKEIQGGYTGDQTVDLVSWLAVPNFCLVDWQVVAVQVRIWQWASPKNRFGDLRAFAIRSPAS